MQPDTGNLTPTQSPYPPPSQVPSTHPPIHLLRLKPPCLLLLLAAAATLTAVAPHPKFPILFTGNNSAFSPSSHSSFRTFHLPLALFSYSYAIQRYLSDSPANCLRIPYQAAPIDNFPTFDTTRTIEVSTLPARLPSGKLMLLGRDRCSADLRSWSGPRTVLLDRYRLALGCCYCPNLLVSRALRRHEPPSWLPLGCANTSSPASPFVCLHRDPRWSVGVDAGSTGLAGQA